EHPLVRTGRPPSVRSPTKERPPMTDHTPEQNTAAGAPAPQKPKRRYGRLASGAVAIALAAGLTGAFVSEAFSRGPGFGGMGFRGPGGLGMHDRMFGGRHGQMDPAQIEERADRAVRHLAVELDASNEQQDKLRGIVKAAVADLVPMREQMRNARERG